MKKIYLLFAIALLALGCNDAEYGVIDNSVYLSDAAGSAKSATYTLDGAEIDIVVNVRIAKKTGKDVTVGLRLSAALLDEYNKANNVEYFPVPGFALPEGAKVTIPAGETGAVYTIKVKDFNTGGKQYALGVELGDVAGGGLAKSASQSRFIYLLAKPLRVPVPVMSGREGMLKAAPDANWGINISQWSLECWARMSAYRINNQALFEAGSNDHSIYIRYGDANRPYNYLQIKTLGGQVQTASDLENNKWYHWAFVYDGVTLTIYRNGEESVKFDPPAPVGGSLRFDYFRMFTSGARYFRDDCSVSQIRLWKKAISQAQIRNNMYYAVNPANPDLMAYWPMDEGTGSTFADISGNGHAATAPPKAVIRWEADVRFDK
jgi:hypothetical protein